MAWELNHKIQVNGTLVPNAFIDEHMAKASGEYVKVYLYLLRHQGEAADAGTVAEALHYTEGDVIRAVSYWEKAGVLEVQEEKVPAASLSESDTYMTGKKKDKVNLPADDDDFTQLLYIAQKYMNKIFTRRECEIFAYLYGELKLPAELLEYLVEFCVQNGHTSIRYMETVAINWHKKGIATVEEAKGYTAGFHKDAFAVMKAFGLNDRRPAAAERQFIESWFRDYGFTREVVLEACNRTIKSTHTPSFNYADKILTEWKKAGVKNLSDVEDLDMIRQSQEKGKSQEKRGEGKRADSRRGNRFHNFEQSATDYDSLMMEKVRARMKE